MATVRHIESMCGNARPPTKSNWCTAREPVFKFRFDLFGSFEDIGNRKFCKVGLKRKRLFGLLKFTFFFFLGGGGFDP